MCINRLRYLLIASQKKMSKLPKSVIDPKDRIEPPLTATGELYNEYYIKSYHYKK